MTTFKIDDKVRVSPDSKFSFKAMKRRFEEVGYRGAIIAADDYLFVVSIDGTSNSAWDYFLPEELERIEGTE